MFSRPINPEMIIPTSKVALKTSCLRACGNDIEKAEKLYDFFVKDLQEIPDFDPEKAIILGDSLTSDILGGINGGIKTCWFNLRGEKGRTDIVPDFEIRTLDEFPPLLERL